MQFRTKNPISSLLAITAFGICLSDVLTARCDLVLTGYSGNVKILERTFGGGVEYLVDVKNVVVARFNHDGTPDTAFGGPTGAKQIRPPSTHAGAFATGLTIDSQKRIVIGGIARAPFNSGVPGYNQALAVRLQPNGEFDTTFDVDGYAVANIASSPTFNDMTSGVAVDVADNVILAGTYNADPTGSPMVRPAVAKIVELRYFAGLGTGMWR